jgi:hypothetical protein
MGSLSGIGKAKASLKVTVTAGNNGAPKIKSFKIKLPKGLSFVAKQLKKGVSAPGATVKLSGGALVVTLKSAASSETVKVSSKAIKVSSSLAKSVKKKKTKSLKVSVSVTDAAGTITLASFTVKSPK